MPDEKNAQFLTPPSLPKGGGTISGSAGSFSSGGPDGAAGYSIPLPVVAGRGLTPGVALNYSSAGGNGPFGMGWQCALPAFRRETRLGVPDYANGASVTGPDGETLLITNEVRNDSRSLLGRALPRAYRVTRYRSRQDNPSIRTEYWSSGPAEQSFWIQYYPDGSLSLFGWSESARLSDPKSPSKVAEWLIEETISANGEHILYRWRGEDDSGCTAEEVASHPEVTGNYIHEICWGNISSTANFFLTGGAPPAPDEWLFSLVFDYGERDDLQISVPEWDAVGSNWTCRSDAFSRHDYGFQVRIRRLCRQVLLYHRTGLLNGSGCSDPAFITGMALSYDESTILSLLTACQQVSYEPDGKKVTLPPMEFEFTRPSASFSRDGWTLVDDLAGFYPQRWQFADLYGEGIPGILYQDTGAWWYREPVRADSGPTDITWERASPLLQAPGAQSGMITDFNSDGQPDWLVLAPGLKGYFSLSPDKTWQHFIPLSAVPSEIHNPKSQLADLTGGGLQDLVMIGPRSVRLWPSLAKSGWGKATEVTQEDGVVLPTFSSDESRLIAFSDVLGSGQLQLIEVSAQGVTCWPGLGKGRFAPPVTLPGFSVPESEFSARRVYMADLDGSGCSDILVMCSRHVRIFINQSGNSYVEGEALELPEGIRLDDTCILQVADIQGLGLGSLIVTVPHPVPQSWCYTFSPHKPWLMSVICNNMGSLTQLTWQSSAQGWLDEKFALKAQGRPAVCHLPFTVHTLTQVSSTDEISGNRYISKTRYLSGVWDGKRREFRGFSYTEQTDTDIDSQSDDGDISPPSQVRSWFLSGVKALDDSLAEAFYKDAQAPDLAEPFFTRLDACGEDEAFEPSQEQVYWLHRAMKGRMLRQEVYGLDGSHLQDIPYAVSHYRWQVRATSVSGSEPVTLVIPLETLNLNYERIPSDPVTTQTFTLSVDAFGSVCKSLSINYPRRGSNAASDYPETLPEGLLDAARDPQQEIVWLNCTRSSWHHIDNPIGAVWMTGLADTTRSDILQLVPADVPVGGFTTKYLMGPQSPVHDLSGWILQGQQKVWWCSGHPDEILDIPGRPALQAFTETAEFDDVSLSAYAGVLSDEELYSHLTNGGYHLVPRLFDSGGTDLWARRNGYTVYGDANAFWQPVKVTPSQLIGYTSITRDAHHCVVTSVTDAADLTTTVDYDWRFLTPNHITDVNDNHQSMEFDALGRPVHSRFWGTEEGEPAGYSPDKSFSPPLSIEEALTLKNIPVSTCHVIVADSWMPVRTDGSGQRCGILALRREERNLHGQEALVRSTEGRKPPYAFSLLTDRYDGDPEQQVRIQVALSDGFGRALQVAVLNPPGEAFVITPDGGLETNEDGSPHISHAPVRWAVTGRTEYDNKGHPVRVWQPFYLNDWQWLKNDSARTGLFADTTFFDAPGRPYRVVTAAGWERRTQYFPWFTVAEDENDTAAEVLSRRDASVH